MPTLAVHARPLLAVVLIMLAMSCPPSVLAQDGMPTIRIVEPADGAVVKGPGVDVRVEVSHFTLQPPGSGKKPNAGHIHYWIDNEGDAMFSGPTTKTVVRLLVAPGRHKIRAELVLDDHTSLAEGHRDRKVLALPDDAAFEHRSSMSTISIDVR